MLRAKLCIALYFCATISVDVNDKGFGWVGGCFEFNGPLRQIQSISGRLQEKEKQERKDRGE